MTRAARHANEFEQVPVSVEAQLWGGLSLK
jgi:hypothetical protein